MLLLKGLPHVVKTVVTLASPHADEPLDSMPALERAYLEFLGTVQRRVPRPASGGGTDYTRDPAVEAALLAEFNAESSLDDTLYRLDARGDDGDRRERQLETMRRRVEELGELFPDFATCFALAVNTVFYAPCRVAAGGTTSNALGVIWIDARPSWGPQDAYEFLVHELGHTLVFLDEWRFGLYASPQEMVDPRNYALSAIRRDRRPLDKALHSALVGAEVLLLRERVLGDPDAPVLHPPTPELRRGILECVDSIESMPNATSILTPYALELLELTRREVEHAGTAVAPG